jgi:hypothetical protein
MALCFGTGTPLHFFTIMSNHHDCDQVVMFLPKINCGENMVRLIFLLIIVFWMQCFVVWRENVLEESVHQATWHHMSQDSTAVFIVTAVKT